MPHSAAPAKTLHARRGRDASIFFLVVGVLASTSSTVRAQVDLRVFDGAQMAPASPSGSRATVLAGADSLSALIELPEGTDPALYGMKAVAPRFTAMRAPLSALLQLSRAHPDWRITWSPPFHPLLDRAAGLSRATDYRNQTGRTGKGVFVGVVDTGVDVFHPDLRNADGTTRIAYFIDFSHGPRGTYPEAEQQCPSDLPCAVFTKGEIDAALRASDRSVLPKDVDGHGTHVTSLAAGNGGASGRYVGFAPEADLVVASAVDSKRKLSDAAIQAGTQLVFWLAEQEGKKQGLDRVPAVVNLSVGTDFGPHDGSSPLDRALASLVGPSHPGRAIVVAAGNSAGIYQLQSAYPNPRGVHTVVNVTEGTRVRIPVVTEPLVPAATSLNAAWFAWIDFRPGDDLHIGLERHDSTWIEPMPRGSAVQANANGNQLTGTVVNGVTSKLGSEFSDANGGAVGIEGTWASSEKFAITLEGRGTASLWVQSYGDLSPESGSPGALFPGATKEGTVALPGDAPDLISVGATLNRADWIDRAGDPITIPKFGALVNPSVDSLAFFSGAGPTSDGRMKPDLVSPGGFVAGAMSQDADPRVNPTSIFAMSTFCSPHDECAVIDDRHAVTLGTSMAAPLVTGAVALLFEGDPTLSSDRILRRLQAGAHHPRGAIPVSAQVGAGTLDLMGALDVENLEARPEARTVSPESSWLTLGAESIEPDPNAGVPALLQLRDAEGRAAAGVRAEDVAIDVSRGRVSAGPALLAPGLVSFSVAAYSGTGGDQLEVIVTQGSEMLGDERLPIAVDVNVARRGFSARGGCSVANGRAGFSDGLGAFAGRREAGYSSGFGAFAALALILLRDTRRKSGVRRARSPDRTGTKDRARRGSCRQ